ncbi:YebG family protein [Endozoicomonas sp. Mp262]|uniref:YebG family protein n=1 Tax=Endozoicomonas sp. Mp262 TaxID=2919499 RepID=UPI0021DA566F
MSITPMWRVDRDGSMFTDKKAAEEHDKMLELADNLSSLLESNLTIEEKLAEEIGLLLARNKETLAKAFKGKPDLILTIGEEKEAEETTSPVKPVAA